ncbi:MAG TPA: hypothetical protein PLO65_01705, partial [Caulobacter sp.]|nr:hypothetical protein [Caulobacter sp.]
MPHLTRWVATAGFAAAVIVGALSPALAQSPPPGYAVPAPLSPTAPIVLTPAQAALLQQTLAESDRHGFEPGEFAPRGPGDAALIDAVVRY